jgi:hypothetical protein
MPDNGFNMVNSLLLAFCRANVSWDHIQSTLGLPIQHVEDNTVFELPLDRIRVTSVDNFWDSVDATVKMDRALVAQAGHLTCMGTGRCTNEDLASHHLATDLSGTVLILPRAVPKVSASPGSQCCVSRELINFTFVASVVDKSVADSWQTHPCAPRGVLTLDSNISWGSGCMYSGSRHRCGRLSLQEWEKL